MYIICISQKSGSRVINWGLLLGLFILIGSWIESRRISFDNKGRIEIGINRIMETVEAMCLGKTFHGIKGEMIEVKVHGDS